MPQRDALHRRGARALRVLGKESGQRLLDARDRPTLHGDADQQRHDRFRHRRDVHAARGGDALLVVREAGAAALHQQGAHMGCGARLRFQGPNAFGVPGGLASCDRDRKQRRRGRRTRRAGWCKRCLPWRPLLQPRSCTQNASPPDSQGVSTTFRQSLQTWASRCRKSNARWRSPGASSPPMAAAQRSTGRRARAGSGAHARRRLRPRRRHRRRGAGRTGTAPRTPACRTRALGGCALLEAGKSRMGQSFFFAQRKHDAGGAMLP